MRLSPVMLALLLALSPVAVALQAAGPAASGPAAPTAADSVERGSIARQADAGRPDTDGNTTTVMTLGTDPARTAFDATSLALGSALAIDRNGLQSRLTVASLDHQLQNAGSIEEKKRILNRYRYRIENRIISLKAREQQVTRAFSNGTISRAEYLRWLGHIDREAGEIRALITALDEREQQAAKFNVNAKPLTAKLVPLEGPIRNRIGKALQGKKRPTRVYVATSDTGVVLSAIVDGTYVREVYRSDNRDPSVTGRLSLTEGEETVIRPQYPWAVSERKGTSHWVYGSIQALRYVYFHPHGNLTAYVDMGTQRVYREIQYKQLYGQHSLPPGPAVSNSSENVTVVVNRTYPGGPLRVKVTNSTGAPLTSRVAVAGEPVGRTGKDGVLWTLGPARQFRVTATHDATTVNVTATPIDLSGRSEIRRDSRDSTT